MIDWFRAWSKGIVIAVIIASLIEMILPDNNSKKYIKIIIGIFVVYTIVSPVINQFSKTKLEDITKINNYIETYSKDVIEDNKVTFKSEDAIKQIYIQNLQSSIKSKLETNGYIASTINITLANDDSYNINTIELTISKKISANENKKSTVTIVDAIRDVTVRIDNKKSDNNSVINETDKNNIKKLLSENYDIVVDNIRISWDWQVHILSMGGGKS